MPKKDWIKELPGGFKIFVRQHSLFGIWYGFSLVLIYEDECVTRYDTAHGYAHRDVLGRTKGLIEKVSCENMSFKEAFEYGLNDLSNNCEAYLRHFLAN
jgi:hypothetical protein